MTEIFDVTLLNRYQVGWKNPQIFSLGEYYKNTKRMVIVGDFLGFGLTMAG